MPWDVPPPQNPWAAGTAPAGLCPLLCSSVSRGAGKNSELFTSPAPVPCEQYPFHICSVIKSLVTPLLPESSSGSVINPVLTACSGTRSPFVPTLGDLFVKSDSSDLVLQGTAVPEQEFMKS